VVEKVEAFEPKLRPHLLPDVGVLENGEIPIVDARPRREFLRRFPMTPSSGRAKAALLATAVAPPVPLSSCHRLRSLDAPCRQECLGCPAATEAQWESAPEAGDAGYFHPPEPSARARAILERGST